jgi:hypothetical protein
MHGLSLTGLQRMGPVEITERQGGRQGSKQETMGKS